MLKDYIVSELRKLADRIETGNCELSDSQAMEVMSVISHEALSKAEAIQSLQEQVESLKKGMEQMLAIMTKGESK